VSLIAKFASVGGATAASRFLGFVREAMIGAALGAGPVADAFYAAFAFPNLFRRLFAEGAFNSAFVPLFARKVEQSGLESAKRFAEEVMAVLILALGVLTVLAIIFMPGLVATVVAPKFADTPDKFNQTVELTRIMFPYLMAMSLMAMLSGIMNSFRKYFLAALAPVLLNVTMIAVLWVAMRRGLSQDEVGVWLAWGVTVSGLLQLGVLIYAVLKEKFLPGFRAPKLTPEVKRLLVLMGPALLTGGVVQINLMIGRIIASGQDGAIALLNYADRINQLPLGIIGIAIGVVLLPELARALGAGRTDEAAHLQNRSLEFGLGITVPAAIALIVMPVPIVNILYERGAFTAETTAMTASALAAFAAGLPAYVLIKVFQPAFFAREDMKRPLYFSVAGVVANIALSFALFPSLGHVGIALATAISAWLQVALLIIALAAKSMFRPSAVTLRRLVMVAVSGTIMGGLLVGAQMALPGWFASPSTLVRVATTLGSIAVAGLAYLALALLTGALDRNELKGALRRRRGQAEASTPGA
jgi:putative peptidoglycan lipid II flippase